MLRYILVFIFCITLHTPALAMKVINESLEHEGAKRIFNVYIPDSVENTRNLPVVFVLHGGGGNAAQAAQAIQMHKTGEKYGFITVYPQGSQAGRSAKMHLWNSGKCCGQSVENTADDVGFISKVIDVMVSKYGADPKRIYSTGHSNGAKMSYTLACYLSDKITAIAPNAGQDYERSCDLKRPVPVMHIHGKADKCAVYGGSKECGGCFSSVFQSIGIPMRQKQGECPPVPDMVAQWAGFNGCMNSTQQTFQKGDVTCNTYTQCKAGADVILCSIEHAGHTWAGASSEHTLCKRNPNGRLCKAAKEAVGATNYDINNNEFMWQFFSRYKME